MDSIIIYIYVLNCSQQNCTGHSTTAESYAVYLCVSFLHYH